MTTINNILGTFAPITLEQMSSVKLMNRTDTKFVTNMAKLRLLLQMAQADYDVQEIDGEPEKCVAEAVRKNVLHIMNCLLVFLFR